MLNFFDNKIRDLLKINFKKRYLNRFLVDIFRHILIDFLTQVLLLQFRLARAAMICEAERIVKCSRVEHVPVEDIGDNVTVPIPPVDRGQGDPRHNIMGGNYGYN